MNTAHSSPVFKIGFVCALPSRFFWFGKNWQLACQKNGPVTCTLIGLLFGEPTWGICPPGTLLVKFSPVSTYTLAKSSYQPSNKRARLIISFKI